MSWSPDLFIGEFRPWPDTVHVVRDMWRELAVACAEQVTSHETLRKVSDRMCELGIEVVE